MENQAPKQNQSVPVASAKNRILTKEKLCKRRWQGLSSCEFCGLFESTDHLFFKCSVARYILCCFWLDTWAILQKKKEKRIVELGSLRIRKTANDAFCRAFGWSPVDRRITGALLP